MSSLLGPTCSSCWEFICKLHISNRLWFTAYFCQYSL